MENNNNWTCKLTGPRMNRRENKECFYRSYWGRPGWSHGVEDGKCYDLTCQIYNDLGEDKGWDHIVKESNRSTRSLHKQSMNEFINLLREEENNK